MPYQTALVAVDLTEDSEQVLARAREIRATQGTRLRLMSVIRPLAEIYGGMDMTVLSPDVLRLEKEAEDQARQHLGELASQSGIPEDEIFLVRGNPAAEIRAQAEAIGADLVIMGTHGRHGLGLLLGSTANGVLHGIGCDVLAVRIKGA